MSGSKTRQFIDTNVLVYAHDASAGEKHKNAADLVRRMWDSGSGCLSVQVLQEFYVTVTQKVIRPLAPQVTSRIIEDLACWHVHIPEPEDILEAIELHLQYKVSFWDAMIIRSAQALDCGVIWSEDLNPGQHYGGVRVLNPFTDRV
ncbi:MAG: PIN domain-containing protein [Bacillota bacterium]|uniref:PIN domain-containing protein n=1 Tax=unclassified Candidatus Desulforudis TaxID=2635950 RepID=UPI003BD791AC